jgi:hypothetical protein
MNHSFADFFYYFSRHLGNGAKNARLYISRISSVFLTEERLAGWCLVSPGGGSGVGLLPLMLPGLALILLNIYFLIRASGASRYYQSWAAVSLIHIPVAEVLSS